MNQSVLELRSRQSRRGPASRRSAISGWQRAIEKHAVSLRSELRLADLDPLSQERVLAMVPNCEVWALKNLPTLCFEHLLHFRSAGMHIGAFAAKSPDGQIDIVFNDAHPPADVRVHLLEEFFHIRLKHPFDVLRIYPDRRVSRTYDEAKEDEAFGCAVAALLPYGGLRAMLASGAHVSRIAEHFAVPTSVVHFRIAATNLGDLAAAPARQLQLLASVCPA